MNETTLEDINAICAYCGSQCFNAYADAQITLKNGEKQYLLQLM